MTLPCTSLVAASKPCSQAEAWMLDVDDLWVRNVFAAASSPTAVLQNSLIPGSNRPSGVAWSGVRSTSPIRKSCRCSISRHLLFRLTPYAFNRERQKLMSTSGRKSIDRRAETAALQSRSREGIDWLHHLNGRNRQS